MAGPAGSGTITGRPVRVPPVPPVGGGVWCPPPGVPVPRPGVPVPPPGAPAVSSVTDSEIGWWSWDQFQSSPFQPVLAKSALTTTAVIRSKRPGLSSVIDVWPPLGCTPSTFQTLLPYRPTSAIPPATPAGRPPVSLSFGALDRATSKSAKPVWSRLPLTVVPSVGSLTGIRFISGNVAPSWTSLSIACHSALEAARSISSYEKPGPFASRIAASYAPGAKLPSAAERSQARRTMFWP